MKIKEAKGGEHFQREAKDYVINMIKNVKTMHKKNGCYYGKFLYKYCDFDTEEDAQNSGIVYKKCKKCFKGEK